jgi:UDP-N-acetylglucosamine 2-epimerase
MRVLSIVGARPQFIKIAPVCRVLRQRHDERLIHTGQHYDADMSDIFFEELGIPKPSLNLGVGALSNLEQVAHMILRLQPAAQDYQPHWIVIYGDTNSTLAGALVGRALNIPVAHVEAGLRSFNRLMPEENNRIVSDHISTALLCPTQTAVDNLANEGIRENVFLVGDVMIDALLQNRTRAGERALASYRLKSKAYFLATIHRPANTDSPDALRSILSAFEQLETQIVLPAHPRLRKNIEVHGLAVPANVQVIAPVGYLDMISLTSHAQIVLTDSGGLQKEAYALDVPCVTLRDETEWTETVTVGWNRIVGADTAAILDGVRQALSHIPTAHPNLYGDGHASERIVEVLERL